MQTDPHSIDFAALRTLRLVYETGSFTAAAQALEVNQSAVSYTIDKLRRCLGDPLFVRQGGGIAATDRCAAIVAEAVQMLERLEAITAPAEFDPAQARATVAIACNYYERQLILPPVIRALRRDAPGLTMSLIQSSAQGRTQLLRSEADLLIGPIRPEEDGFYCRNLLGDRYVCVMDPEHPLAGTELTLARYTAARHAVITYAGSWKSGYLVQLEAAGRKLAEVLTVPSPSGIEAMLAGTDMVATLPERLARNLPGRVHIAPCPVPAPFEIDLVWTARTHAAPMHVWLRDLIRRTTRATLGPS
ncbi:LysR family transcriptional regulator [Psychromarinibacter sp. C21-152]|uniref:LysR family transcriptional regulator n=1 Tax=Psychromarinibacter sediminicola TaxID=3033385 RepID=A0AAE3T8K1_9RHOB|nr:LysR family transcriptional regulator [Psychromarinibacter sediminicola]MDF0600803.1 LysR family transcriptional regulator [Psychromarinibacter sediminicola]